MKTSLLFCIALLCFLQTKAQDKIVLTGGDTIDCRILEIQDDAIRFQVDGKDNSTRVTPKLVLSYLDKGVWLTLQLNPNNAKAFVLDTLGILNAQGRLQLAGNRFKASTSIFYAGAAITLLGALMAGASAIVKDNTAQKVFLYGGLGAVSVGSIISLTAFIPIGQAGIELRKIKLVKD
ncbi:MAG: hypothetical protein ACI9YU_000620 [Flavobacteriales bacterium]|jgi:hypothetical protein